MSWSTPRTWTTSELVTAAIMNTHVRDNLTYLYSGKNMVYIPARYMSPATTNPCGGLTQTQLTAQQPEIQVLSFDGTSAEYAVFDFAFPGIWNASTITYKVRWTSTATDTDGVVWGLQGYAASDSDAINTAFGTAQEITDNAISASRDMYISSASSALTIAGTPAKGDHIWWTIYRDPTDGSDTMAEDAELIGIEIYWTSDVTYET